MAAISPSASELEGMTSPQDLALEPRRQPPPLPGFSPKVPEGLVLPDLEGSHLLVIPALFDFSNIEVLELTISHTPVMSEVHYCLQAQSLARVTLPSTSDQEYQGPSLRDKEA